VLSRRCSRTQGPMPKTDAKSASAQDFGQYLHAEEVDTQSSRARFFWSLESTSLVGHGRNPTAETKPSLFRLQPKLRIGAVDDPLEREADRMADRVLHMPDARPRPAAASLSAGGGFVQRKCSCGGSCDSCKSEAAHDEQGPVRLKPAAATLTTTRSVAPPIVHDVLRSPGRPLDAATKSFMEPRFGREFSHVRVHTGSAAELSAMDVNARAYTVGSHIVFGQGHFAPGTQEGRRLIAHELTHVVQQSGRGSLMVSREEADPEEEKTRGALKHAATAGAGVMAPEEFKQLKCVIRLGGVPVVSRRGPPEFG
jgi:hypothetical protein